ncbi:hypothetical protein OC861_004474 [Tilletia horrida]|nr:hypothetical protein OC861_004474 [Tilletia horrida]
MPVDVLCCLLESAPDLENAPAPGPKKDESFFGYAHFRPQKVANSAVEISVAARSVPTQPAPLRKSYMQEREASPASSGVDKRYNGAPHGA